LTADAIGRFFGLCTETFFLEMAHRLRRLVQSHAWAAAVLVYE
jgi:hypothetical protein